MPSVLIIGSRRPEALEMSYRRAFCALGWHVEMWDPNGAVFSVTRGGRIGRLFSTFVNVEPWVRKANVALLQLIQHMQPDLVLVVATARVRAGTLAQARVLAPRAKIYMLYPDSPHSLDTERIACLRVCDRVAVTTPSWVASFERLGATMVTYLPFAADTELFHPLPLMTSTLRPHSDWDVGFVGSWRPERETLLESLADFNTIIWGGTYWRTRTRAESNIRRRWAGRELIGNEITDACARTSIMLNILDSITWPGPNMRSFELPACRAFVLSTRSPAILEVFQEGKTIECFDSPDEAKEKIGYFLSKPDVRARIAVAAHDFVISRGHTYLDRARTIISWISNDR